MANTRDKCKVNVDFTYQLKSSRNIIRARARACLGAEPFHACHDLQKKRKWQKSFVSSAVNFARQVRRGDAVALRRSASYFWRRVHEFFVFRAMNIRPLFIILQVKCVI